MANRMLRLTVHDPIIIRALDELREARKQSAFVVEALRHFLSTSQGQEQLDSYVGLKKRKGPTSVPREFVETVNQHVTEGKAKTNLDDIFKF
jgi:hypothetical protein